MDGQRQPGGVRDNGRSPLPPEKKDTGRDARQGTASQSVAFTVRPSSVVNVASVARSMPKINW